MRKAEEFYASARDLLASTEDEANVADSCVTLFVHAGIAAADVLCCRSLGRHASGESHIHAIELLGRVSPGGRELSKALSALLGMKTSAGYGSSPVTAEQRRRAQRAGTKLIEAARTR